MYPNWPVVTSLVVRCLSSARTSWPSPLTFLMTTASVLVPPTSTPMTTGSGDAMEMDPNCSHFCLSLIGRRSSRRSKSRLYVDLYTRSVLGKKRKEREREKGQFLENAAPLRWKLNHGYLVTYLVLGFFTSNRSHSVTSGRITQSKLISISSNHKSLHHRFV